ncbi:osmoprotectant transport system permease protein [Austwickia chelonae]|uniref:Putative ABC transporter permease protein n=1 Tax=Austwickia chelonae NBRC 105200 TaxID=1184607 RepID=K6V8M5_9MICO|nr:ABC transporter permease subunit [Austwickia chelonae]GAB78558.1 putative ABC transporter permease protein [Austwickia chelonae NBRC 105200]SEW40777.1 osmoprotectant transport system permease protein [Austwickia chelonae]
MTWLAEHLDLVASLAAHHAYLAGLPLILGLALALPLGWLAHIGPHWARSLLLAGTGLLYTIPSLALFVLAPMLLGTKILDPINVVVAMTVYTVALLVRSVADGLASVPEHVSAAATAMGYGGLARFLRVDLPLSVPVLAAGLRVAAVSNVSMVSVASLIGVAQLGNLLTAGYQRFHGDELVVGILACIALAVLFDLVILGASALLTPWRRVGGKA